MRRLGIAITLASAMIGTPSVSAQQIASAPISSFQDGILVTSGDVTTCPYTAIGAVSVNMRAHSWALKELAAGPISSKLRERAQKLGADAVILVTVGESHMTLTALRSTPITGRAIHYVNKSCAPTS